jgi:hypothetical protein
MSSLPWLIISIAVLLILALVVLFVLKKGKKSPPDYYAFFILGIMWMAIGIAWLEYPFAIMGFVFAIIGLVNKGKWKKNHIAFDRPIKKGKRLKFYSLLLIAVLVAALVALISFLIVRNI